MKIKHLLFSALAFATVAASCNKEPNLSDQQADLQLSAEEVVFETSDEAVQTKTITVTANRNWEVTVPESAKSWLAVSPESGEASADAQTVEVTVQKNEGTDHTAEVSFRIVGVKKTLKVVQKGSQGAPVAGDGSEKAPFKASEALAKAKALDADAPTDEYYITGTVSAIKNIALDYGNAEYSISDDGTDKDALSVYRGYSIDGNKFTKQDEIKVGDVLVIKGKLVNFKGNTPQVNTGSSIVSINGQVPEVPKGEATGLVVATSKNGFLMKTDSGYQYVFDNQIACPVKVGDNVTVNGNKDEHNGIEQLTKYTHTINSSGNEVVHPQVTVLDGAALDAYKDVFGYVKTTGVLSISGNYYNINIPGANKTGSLSYPVGVSSDMNSKNVDVTGYFVGLSGSDQYFNILMTEIQVSAEQPEIEEPDAKSIVLTFPDENQANNKVNDYVSTWEAKTGNMTFQFTGFNNYEWNGWTYIRCGRKKDPSTPSMKTLTPAPVVVDKVVLTLNKCKPELINSAELTVATDDAFTQDVQTVDVKDLMKKGDVEIAVPNPAANLYYKLDMDLKSESNGFIELGKVVLWVNK